MTKRTTATATALLTLCIASAAFAGDTKTEDKIKTVDAAVEKADAETLKVFTMAKIKARQKALEDLGRLKKEAFAKEDLDACKAVKDKMDATTKEIDDLLATVKEVKAADETHPVQFVGKWTWIGAGWGVILEQNGTVTEYKRGMKGTWTYEKRGLVIRWADNHEDIHPGLSKDKKNILGANGTPCYRKEIEEDTKPSPEQPKPVPPHKPGEIFQPQ